MTRLAGIAVVVLLAVTPVAVAEIQRSNVNLEADEADRNGLEARGQDNCIAEARDRRETPTCYAVTTPRKKNPEMGYRVLDGFYATIGARLEDAQGIENSDPRDPNLPHVGSANWARAANSEYVPDLIVPGAGTFFAWRGYWNDLDGDGYLEISCDCPANLYDPDNEWSRDSTGTVVSFVEPGSHPHVTSTDRPDSTSPDIVYASGDQIWKTPDDNVPPILFLDGSILERYTVVTISNAILAPSEDGKRPYTTKPDSRVDIDDYATANPVFSIYATTLRDTVVALGSPSLGSCPNACAPGPLDARGTPAGGVLHPLQRAVWAPYESELETSSRSSSSGRASDFEEAYRTYGDLQPRTGFVAPDSNPSGEGGYRGTGPLAGVGEEGRQASLPGFLSFEARVGLWKDINADGFIGSVDPDDPYAEGTKPLADDFTNSRGEFFGAWAKQAQTTQPFGFLTLTLTPIPSWGSPGVLYLGGGNAPFVGKGGLVCNPNETLCARDPRTHHYTGSEPITLLVRKDPGTVGRYVSESVFLPTGTADFAIDACTATWQVANAEGGMEDVWDCDRIERLDPEALVEEHHPAS